MADNLGLPASTTSNAPENPPLRTRQRTPTITIDTTVTIRDRGNSNCKNLVLPQHVAPQPQPATQPSHRDEPFHAPPSNMDGGSSSSPPGQVTTPSTQNPLVSGSNLLNVPTMTIPANHQRNGSFGSSGTSAWTPSSSTGLASSDIGDNKSDIRALIKSGPQDPEIPNNPFAFTPKQMAKLHDPKDLNILRAMGGLDGLVYGLRTDVKAGLSPDEDRLEGNITLQDVWHELETRKKDKVQQSISDKDVNEEEANEKGKEHETTQEPQRSETRKSTASRRPTLMSTKQTAASKGFSDRKRVFSENRIPARKPKSIFQLMWMALHDKILILLSIAAVISLALGFYQSFRPGAHDKVEWVEGVAILVAITIVTVVQSVNDYQKERQFMKLNSKKEDRNVKVIRGGKTVLVNVYEIVVGDVLHLEPGDLIPVDGVLPEGHNIKADESAATGESDALKKVPADYALENTEPGAKFSNKFDPFVLSGGKVLEGVGKYVVTAVGPNSYHGRTMMSLREEPEDTPLQLKLNRVADMIAKVGGAAALLLFVVLLIKFLAQLPGSTQDAGEKGQRFMQILIVSVTIVVVAVPEGLPLAVTLALAYATTRMLKDNNLVRVLKACETMGNATTVCSDKTGTLTQNKMTVIAGTLGVTNKFGDKRQTKTDVGNTTDTEKPGDEAAIENEKEQEKVVDEDGVIPMRKFFDDAVPELRTLLRASIALNSTAFEGTDEKGNFEFIGSKTETALLGLARTYLGLDSVRMDRENTPVIQPFPFSSERKCMGCVIKVTVGGQQFYRLLVKGASEILLKYSTHVTDISSGSLQQHPLSDKERRIIEETIMDYATQSLRTIGLVYRDFPQWPPPGARTSADDRTQAEFADVFSHMTFIGVVGIMDPLRPGVTKAVEDCRKAGVFVRMVTGDNVLTAKAIASECGIFTPGGIVMEGPKFRTLSPSQMDQIIPRLQVLARSSPEDKRILVKRLKELGETVAVTGDGTNDGPALKMADVGFSMGIAGTEVAKEASSIILMDDNFASIVKAIMWGRCVSDAVKKFLQFQLTVNVTAVVLAFVSSVASSDEQSALTAVQLLWVNLIMDTFAALALATDPPTLELLNRKPEPKGSSIISFNMWKMIFGQAILQLVITFVLNFAGLKIFTGWDADHMKTVVFNTFVWLQIFNEINCRRLDDKLNVFSGMQRNPFFIAITLIMIGGQVLIVFVGGTAFSVTNINGEQWAASIILGLLSLPFGAVIRLIPNAFIKIFIPRKLLEHKRKTTIIDEEKVTDEWNPAIDDVRDDLMFIKSLRSKRRLGTIGNPRKAIRRLIPSSSTKDDTSSHRRRSSTPGLSEGPPSPSPSPSDSKRSRSRSNSAFRPAAMVPALVATSMLWSPSSPSEAKSAEAFPVTMSREALEKFEGLEFHKDTDPNDPIVGEDAAVYSPLETKRPHSAEDKGEKAESSRSHWRGRLSVHSRGASRSSVTSASPVGTQPPVNTLSAPRRDASRESRSSSKSSNAGKASTPTEEKREGE